MKSVLISILPAGLLAVVGLIALAFWASVGPQPALQARVPGLDRPANREAAGLIRPLVGKLETFDGQPSAITASWRRAFRRHRTAGRAVGAALAERGAEKGLANRTG
jgi:hypothetical protein